MNIWGLFDDGNGCYSQATDEYNMNMGGQHTITSIGIGNVKKNKDLNFEEQAVGKGNKNEDTKHWVWG